MKTRWQMIACLLLCGVLVWFLADAGQVRQDVSAALALCARSVIPALFPFLVVSTLLLRLGFGELAAPWLAGLMEPLFRVDGVGSAALLLGLVGGYPIGAQTTAELYRRVAGARDGGGAAAGLLQQLQPGVSHQRAGRWGYSAACGPGSGCG